MLLKHTCIRVQAIYIYIVLNQSSDARVLGQTKGGPSVPELLVLPRTVGE
jgi:hypothetical protein